MKPVTINVRRNAARSPFCIEAVGVVTVLAEATAVVRLHTDCDWRLRSPEAMIGKEADKGGAMKPGADPPQGSASAWLLDGQGEGRPHCFPDRNHWRVGLS